MSATQELPGVYGAKRQSWKKDNPRDLLKELITATPAITDKEICDAIKADVIETPEYLDAILEYWVANNARSFRFGNQDVKAARAVAKARTEKIKKAASKTVAAISKRIVDEAALLVEPILAMTFGQCAKAGGKIAKLAKRGKPNQIVGSVFSKSDLLAMWKDL